jgi:molecular chaperone GrpE (heat shock protein)
MVKEASATRHLDRTTIVMTAANIDEAVRGPEGAPEPDRATMTRALRELEAARARVERDAQRVHDETRSKLVVELLPVLDNLDRTIQAAIDRGSASTLVDGVRLVRAQLESVLRGYGVERIDAVGARFDPSVHDAIHVARVQDPAHHAIVLDQTEAGYRFGDRLLRPAKVVVGRATV